MVECSVALAIYSSNVEKDDITIVDILVRSGYSKEFSERMVLYLPIVFGRHLIRKIADIEFSDDLVVRDCSGAVRVTRFSDDEFFNRLTPVSEVSWLNDSVTLEQYMKIAERSWEFVTVCNVLHDLEKKTGKSDPSCLAGSRLRPGVRYVLRVSIQKWHLTLHVGVLGFPKSST
jgi:hypothetical protein